MQHNYRRDICAKMHLLQKIPRSRFQQHTKSEKKKTSKNKKKYYYNDVVVEVEGGWSQHDPPFKILILSLDMMYL